MRQMDPPPLPRCILTSEAVDLGGMGGCHRKLWVNVMDVIVTIKKTNTWGKTNTKRDKDKHDEE